MLRLFTFAIILSKICNFAHAYTVCGEPGDQEAIAKIRLLLYERNSTRYAPVSVPLENIEFLTKFMSPDKDTVLHIHGWGEYPESEYVQSIVRAYSERGNVNLLVLDWSNMALTFDYNYASKQVPSVGEKLGKAINKIMHVIKWSTFHVVGHSLGVHIASQAAKTFKITLHRLTGLEPARPLFYPSSCHLKPSDAEIVVALHTDTTRLIAVPYSTAQVDFYANKGALTQPPCSLLVAAVCNHQISVLYYAESIMRHQGFPSYKCSDTSHSEPPVYFGDAVPKSITGEYCFDTNAITPFGQGS